jgi:hypothetical protein
MIHAQASFLNTRRPGTVTVLVAVCLTALLAVVAITLDGGLLLDDRWRAQAAADSAALAAAADLYANFALDQGLDKTGSATKSALSIAAANGFTNDGTTSVVTVNIPPKAGNHAGQAGYAEVIVQFNQARNFSTIFHLFNPNASGTIPVTARAVARGLMQANSGAGIICLNPTAPKALDATGNGTVTVKSGPIIVDSNASNAGVAVGNGGISAPEVNITGQNPGYVTTGSGQIVTSPTANNVNTGQIPTPDPLAYLPAPEPSALPVQSTTGMSISKNTTLQPGVYTGGISISGGTITLQPGIYYMDHGGFSVSNGNVSGTGVMIYNDPTPNSSGQKIDFSSLATLNLSAPTGGTYQGMLIFQSRDAGPVPVNVSGSSKSQMIGAVYAPSAPVQLSGNGTVTLGSEFICDTLHVSGSGSLTVSWNGAAGLPKRDIRLVE